MPQVDLETVNNTVKTALPVLRAAAGDGAENDFAWIDRIANLLDKVTQFAQVYRQQFSGQNTTDAAQARQIDIEIERRDPAVVRETAPPPVLPPQGENKAMQAIKLVLPIIEQYLIRCQAENPKMPLGEVISRLDIINVSETLDLLIKYKQSQGIK